MKPIPLLTIALVSSLALAACNKAGTNTGATTSSTTVASAPTSPSPTSDASSPNPPVSSSTAGNTSATQPAGASGPNAVTDTVVTGKVKAAISSDAGMKDADVAVKTENGNVTLTGTVKSQDQVTLAAALAQRQEGVNRVENQVAVR
jgi:hyperosmotically inducible protein